MQYGGYIWINIGSGNGLLPDSIKPLPEPIWLIKTNVLWYSPEGNITGDA